MLVIQTCDHRVEGTETHQLGYGGPIIRIMGMGAFDVPQSRVSNKITLLQGTGWARGWGQSGS